MENKRTCLHCGESFVGRTDKKFCNNLCRNAYNNKNKNQKEEMIIAVNRILRKNRKILQMLNPTGKTTVRKTILSDLEFDFKYHTHTFSSKQFTYYFCYEYGYTFIIDNGKEKVLIVNKQPYMEQNSEADSTYSSAPSVTYH